MPAPAPSHLFVVGDQASLPAVNSLLGALGSAPATIWFEGALDGLPCPADPERHEVREVPRPDSGAHLVERVRADLPDLLRAHPDPYVRVACDTATTRTPSAFPRKEQGVPEQRMHALGYWRTSRPADTPTVAAGTSPFTSPGPRRRRRGRPARRGHRR